MAMSRWDPWREMRRMQETMDRLWRGTGRESDAMDIAGWTMPMDILETNDSIVVQTAVPGIDPGHIDVSVEDNVLTISAERHGRETEESDRYLMQETSEGVFRRSVRLPNIIDAERAESACENGMLTVTFPKQEQKKAKRIQISSGGGQQQLGSGGSQQAA